ncbi:hypothetical protein CQA49_07360 [Helicobacter sp. MIT 00-7814]|uniref:mechanosensitive ion channel domain-containing protein n=1 Tax=unclassified Helicobacter TaxID=2593540 RepID=UPI000E1EE82E|nr:MULTISPECIES: mechanosensitive ion channel domain-containing protein [unclassified Helicobacter]RDU52971.1 hypothetical protein CQA49_07360 [Helicobacter sp. MIT 00-7814]RDU53869.1 hypothetical protein CQA37_06480 [Helicobacter sp. MIT 99-10781]
MKAVIFLCVLFFASVSFGQNAAEAQALESKLARIDQAIAQSNNPWLKQYENIKTYGDLSEEIERIESELSTLESHTKDISQINQLKSSLQTLKKQLELVESYAKNPYDQLLDTPDIKDIPHITNPILIVSGYSFIKNLQSYQNTMEHNQKLLDSLLENLEQKYDISQTLAVHYRSIQSESAKAKEYETQLLELKKMIQSLGSAQKILKTSHEIYFKNIDDVKNSLEGEIKEQVFKMISIAIAIVAIILIALSIKLALRKYLDDNRVYTANKVINFLNISLVAIILLFAYLENVTYLVAIVGFASAGLAIAMKDLFMSVLGWFVIVLGGSVHVGDRVKVIKDGAVYVGDVLDISVLRLTIYEDITLTSYMENRRAGRIIFIPNNYVFTTLLANYTHAGIKTVWDGIDFTITFDSNYKKALKIATEIGKKYSKGYTEVTRKRMERLKDRFSLRNMNLETRAFCMLEPNGIRISLWYQVNSYATLTLRSTISAEIIEHILQEDDIHIAYQTTKVVTKGGDGIGNKPFMPEDLQNPNAHHTSHSSHHNHASHAHHTHNASPKAPPFAPNKEDGI